MSWMSSFGPVETRNRPPTPDFPVSPSDFTDSPASNTTPRQHKIQRHDSAKMLRGRPSTPDRSSPLQSPVMSHPHSMQTIPPSPRSARRVKVLPDSPQPVRNRPPTPEESVLQDLSWLQHYVVWKEREQPIFTTKAHVFMIDPETKKNWIPASKSSVSVSYYYDSTRNTYRIISVDGSKAIVNSIITPGMTFTKTSQKFGQWSDPKANTVYGLGFGSEGDLAKFIEKFKEVKDLTRQQAAQNAVNAQVNGNAGSDERDSAVQSPTQQHTSRHFLHTRSSSLSSMQGQDLRENVNIRERRNSFNSPTQNGGSPDAQLKYENDRLKLALAQSSANAKKWEIELQTLKNNNSRLTSALQESTANVEEWKKQLAAYKEDSTRMKKKIAEMERQQTSPDQVLALQGELQQLTERLERVQLENQDKQDEINQLNQQVREYSEKQNTNTNLESRVKFLEEENEKLKLKNTDLQRQLDESRMQYDQETSELLHLQDTLGSKVTELYEIHEQIVSTIRKESQS